MCIVYENCVFNLLYNLGNTVQNYSENPGYCISGVPDFKIFPGEHAPGPPRWLAPSVRDCPPQVECPGAATEMQYDCRV